LFKPRSRTCPTHIPQSGDRKRLRLHMFPFCLKRRTLTSSQCAAYRLYRKPDISLRKRIHQLQEIQAIANDLEDRVHDAKERMLVLFQSTASIHSVTFTDPRPPPIFIFNGCSYSWISKGVKICFRGLSTRHFTLDFDFSTFISNHEHVVIHI